jgi:hypothetical protein
LPDFLLSLHSRHGTGSRRVRLMLGVGQFGLRICELAGQTIEPGT